jgi:hypothetical protein
MAKTNAKRRTPKKLQNSKLQKTDPNKRKLFTHLSKCLIYKSGIGVSSRPGSESPEGEVSFCAKEDYYNKGCPAYSISLAGRKHIKNREGFIKIVTDSASERTTSNKSAGSKRRVVRCVRPIKVIRLFNMRVDSYITVAETDSLFLR